MQRADLQLLVSQRKSACVLDPALLLCHAQGLLLATRLTQVMEPWLTRSFWQALDASELLLRRMARGNAGAGAALSPTALSDWIGLREGSTAGTSPFRWIGDRLPESHLHESADAGVLDRYEQLAEAMTGHCDRHPRLDCRRACTGFDATAAALDALVLSATLDGALVLSTVDEEPGPVRAAQGIGMATRHLESMAADSLFNAERAFVRHALAAAGLAAMLETWPPLAALHVLAPQEADAPAAADEPSDPWASARLWWYRV